MFKCINNKGFQVSYMNGWTVSVMFGKGNYTPNRFDPTIPHPHEANIEGGIESPTAEVCVYKGQPETVYGWLHEDEVTEIMAQVSILCHCGGDFKRSDHCPECGCEEHERTCDHVTEAQITLDASAS